MSRYWMGWFAGFAALVSTSAVAVPTRYIVFTMDADDEVQPVFYTEVDLARPTLPGANTIDVPGIRTRGKGLVPRLAQGRGSR